MENAKVKTAVSVTVLALGGLAGVAVASNDGGSNSEPAATLKPKVRTEVIHRTIHRTKKAKAAVSAAAVPAAAYSTTPASTYVAPAATQPAAAVSSSSGSGGEGGYGGGGNGSGGGYGLCQLVRQQCPADIGQL